jgi:alcohol dehydrogenase, propanol-preferring
MKAAVMERVREALVVKEIPSPSIGDEDVLIRIHGAGVCHTDLHIADGILETLGLDPFPLVLGHEITGVIEQVGANVTHLKPGDKVGAYWWFGCGHCRYCFSGEEENCTTQFQAAGFTQNGGYGEYYAVPGEYAVPLPAELDVVEAAPLLCAGLTVYGGFKNAGLKPGQRAAVLGIGGLGHMAIQVAAAMGAEVIAITSSDNKVKLAEQLGAHHVLLGTGEEIGPKLRDMGGADVVLTTTVDAQSLTTIMQGILPQGALVFTGATTEPLPIIPMSLLFPQHRIMGSLIGSRRELQEVLQLAAKHRLRSMIETYSLEEANKAHDRLRANQVRFRAVLTPS